LIGALGQRMLSDDLVPLADQEFRFGLANPNLLARVFGRH